MTDYAQQLTNLADALVEDIMSMSDEEILAEGSLPHNGQQWRKLLAQRNGEPIPLDAIDKLESEAQDYANTGNGFGKFLMLVACLCGLGLLGWAVLR